MTQTPDEVTTQAFHWVVQRPDGIGFATTSHDSALVNARTTFEPNADLRPSELFLTDQMFGSSLELSGRLSSPALAINDIVAGRWSGASLRFQAGDWAEGTDPVTLCEGEVGKMQFEGEKLSVSVDLLPRARRLAPCVETSPECRAMLGDAQCRVDMRSRQRRVSVIAVDPHGIVVDQADNAAFVMGRLRWLSGDSSGLEHNIIAAEGAKLILQGASPLPAEVGDRALITEGCDGRRSTCSDRFRNILNFRGEPDLPGSEILLRFPGA